MSAVLQGTDMKICTIINKLRMQNLKKTLSVNKIFIFGVYFSLCQYDGQSSSKIVARKPAQDTSVGRAPIQRFRRPGFKSRIGPSLFPPCRYIWCHDLPLKLIGKLLLGKSLGDLKGRKLWRSIFNQTRRMITSEHALYKLNIVR